ncbi:unnamed protein product [Penicillium salamii]|nr:unnamed protein product [Penicillium salamii]
MLDDHQQKAALGIVVAFAALGGIAILLRLWSRRLTRTALTSDDYLVLLGYVRASVLEATGWADMYRSLPSVNRSLRGTWNFANQIIYNPALSIVKVSMLIFLHRLNSQSRVVRYLIWASLATVITLCLAVLLVDIFQCTPVAYVYDMSIPGGKCIDQGAFYVSTAALNLTTDIMVLSIPIIITARLQMPMRRKIAVCIILCLGAVATAIGVWRIIILAQGFIAKIDNPDPTYSIGFCSSAIEVNLAVITACGPSLKAISTRYLPKVLGSSRRGTKTGYGTGTGTGSRGRKFPMTNLFSKSATQHKSLHSSAAGYEMADPLGGPRFDVEAEGFDAHKYGRKTKTPSIESEEVPGIVRTTDITVGYSVDPADAGANRLYGKRPASADSMF